METIENGDFMPDFNKMTKTCKDVLQRMKINNDEIKNLSSNFSKATTSAQEKGNVIFFFKKIIN